MSKFNAIETKNDLCIEHQINCTIIDKWRGKWCGRKVQQVRDEDGSLAPCLFENTVFSTEINLNAEL